MATKSLPSPDVLRQLLQYEPDTGKLFWRYRGDEWFPSACYARTWNARFSGQEAITAVSKRGVLHGAVQSVTVKAHRLIWAMQTGRWPSAEIDHVDGNPSNNRWTNLRCVTREQNQQNVKQRENTKSGAKGLWRRPDGKWRVRIQANKIGHEVGVFRCKTAAAMAYARASAELHGQYRRGQNAG